MGASRARQERDGTGRPGGRPPGAPRLPVLRLAAALALAVLAGLPGAALAAAPAKAEPASLDELQARAAAVRREVARLDRDLAAAVERYDQARSELDAVNARLAAARADLVRTEAALEEARTLLAARVTAMYKSEGLTVLDLLLGLDDLAAADTDLGYFAAIARADDDAVRRTETLRRQAAGLVAVVEREREAALQRELELRSREADVEDRLAARQALLAGIEDEVRRLLAEQARREAAEARRLAAAAGLDLAHLEGSPAQVAVVREALRYLGVPYVWGGASPETGFDCSGLVMYVYARFGVTLPHAATLQARLGRPVPLAELQPADLVFFGSPSFYRHVGIYIGDGLFIEAPHTGAAVRVSRLAGRGCSLACRYPVTLR